ncbi:alpha/beta hydrolase [Labrys sp. ZIDIC5]|uniref:alpha/beta hydrolase n=1 Tax=Labrys sedimenti TaxID=3106036 RepID=UPI002ACAB753|nr:alpha/beta fold hydrolase [Labrys sp. ZIDIC5]MDZ5450507.1 acetylxylan esterase [Labrys sp. ZIDIC5]
MASLDTASRPFTIEQQDVAFAAEPGVVLRGWLFRPAEAASPLPAITMAHGYAGTAHHGLFPFARAFAEAGFVVLLHDHRNFGGSDAPEPGDIDPWQQISDWRSAISFLESRPEVDADRISLWGTSYAGGHAIVLGATDRRLKAVVAQVPTISGYGQGLRRVAPDAMSRLEATFVEDDRRRFRGEPGQRIAVVGNDGEKPAAYRSPDAISFYLQDLPEGCWSNEVTLRSGRAARMYEPGAWIERVSPTPLMLIVAMADAITLTDLALAAYERALEPKKLVTVKGGHFDPYLSQFARASEAAVAWFRDHLCRSSEGTL